MENNESPRLVFSPTQIAVGSYFGGPVAAVYYIWDNFRSMGETEMQGHALKLGGAFIIALTISLPFIPENTPNSLIPAIYTAIAAYVATKHQVTKEQAAADDRYVFYSNWTVAKVALLSMLAYFGSLIAILMVMAGAGYEL